jgi:nucleotide-binding universal stress UspA family protein
MFKKILLPTDGSEVSEKAVRRCMEFAKSIGAGVVGFHAEHRYSLLAYGAYAETGDVDTAPPTKEELARTEEALATKSLAAVEAAAREAGVECECFCLAARHPFEAIIRAAEEKGCDLIFMAFHGRRGLASLLLGSETIKVLTHTRVPVLVHR